MDTLERMQAHYAKAVNAMAEREARGYDDRHNELGLDALAHATLAGVCAQALTAGVEVVRPPK